jgi:hypothetical protein
VTNRATCFCVAHNKRKELPAKKRTDDGANALDNGFAGVQNVRPLHVHEAVEPNLRSGKQM